MPAPRARVRLRRPTVDDERVFLAAVRRSRDLHGHWATPPDTHSTFVRYVERRDRDDNVLFLAERREDEALVGVVNLSQIYYGPFRNAYVGYFGFAPHTGRGYMTEAVDLGLRYAFRELGLHRVEANIQPDNDDSKALVSRLGFRHEGYSPRYLKIAGRWRDHERFALLADEWRPRVRA